MGINGQIGKYFAYLWLAAALAFLSVSGNTVAFIPAGILILMILVVVLFFHLILMAVMVAKGIQKLKGGPFWSRSLKLVLISMILGDLFFALGAQMGHEKSEESKRRGDRLVEMIENFRATEGHLPESLEELQEKKGEIPAPAFSGAKFRYRKIEHDAYFIKFDSVASSGCIRNSADPVWLCMD